MRNAPHFIDSDYGFDAPRSAPTDGPAIASGRGLFASMLSWIKDRMLGDPEAEAAARVAGRTAPSPDAAAASPAANTGRAAALGRFDSAELMRHLRDYHERHRDQLHGAGLVIGFDRERPAPAFPIIDKLHGGAALDEVSYLASDYEDLEAAYGAIQEGLDLERSPAQVAWLVNAACVRGALQMAGFTGAVHYEVQPGKSVKMVFEAGDASAAPSAASDAGQDTQEPRVRVAYEPNDSPLSLGAAGRKYLGYHCRKVFQDAAAAVASEFAAAVAAQARLTPEQTTSLRGEASRRCGMSGAVVKLSRSYVAFSNLHGLITADKAFIAGMDRDALANASRHGTKLTLDGYLVHSSEPVRSEVLAHRALGALAYAHYSESTLLRLIRAHGPGDAIQSLSMHPGGGSNGPAYEVQAASYLMARVFEAHLSEPAKALLQTVSPRYLASLFIGDQVSSSEPAALRVEGLRATAQSPQVAGARLACALNIVVGDGRTRTKLPWSAAFGHEALLELLHQDIPQEQAIQGLVNFMEVANAHRARGDKAADLRHVRIDWEGYAQAPAADPVGSLLRLVGATSSPRLKRAGVAQMALARELLAPLQPITTQPPGGDAGGRFGGAITWAPELVSVQPTFERSESANLTLVLRQQGSPMCAEITTRLWRCSDPGAVFEYEPGGPKSLHTQADHGTTWALGYLRGSEPRTGAIRLGSSMTPLHGGPLKGPLKPWWVSKVKINPDSERAAVSKHLAALSEAVKAQVDAAIQAHPLEFACLAPAVAEDLRSGEPQLPAVGKAKAFRLATVCLGADNASGLSCVIAAMKNPFARNGAALSVLDIALESKESDLPMAALQALAAHPVAQQNPQALVALVQGGLGKLVERHPRLLPTAIGMGATMDETLATAWEALHPASKTPETQAAMVAVKMRATIDRLTAEAAAAAAASPQPEPEPAAPAPRRRLRI